MEAIIFIGIQAAGKTSFYMERFFKTHIRINLDMLRTRHRESLLLNTCIEMKQPFVVDNTNPKKQDRERYIARAKEAGFQIIGYYFQSQLLASIERNNQRNEEERIPEMGIRATHARLELPSYQEGFDKLYYVTIGEDKHFIVKDWQNEV